MDLHISISSRLKVAIIAGLLVLYVAVYGPLFPVLGFSTGMLSTVPVVVTAWFFGARGGIVAGLLTYPLNGTLVTFLTASGWMDIPARGGALGSAAEVVVGLLVGRLRDLLKVAKADEQARIERAEARARAQELGHSRERIVAVAEALRREIAHHLHSSVQSKLIILQHHLRELGETVAPGEPSKRLEEARQITNELIERDIEAISQQLYPAILRRRASSSLADPGRPVRIGSLDRAGT